MPLFCAPHSPLAAGAPLTLRPLNRPPSALCVCLPQVMQWINGYQEILAEFGVEEQEVRHG